MANEPDVLEMKSKDVPCGDAESTETDALPTPVNEDAPKA